MSKIFLDGFFGKIFINHDYNGIHNHCQYNVTKWIESLPDDCDVVGISFYENNYDSYLPIVNQVLTKTKKLLINISEPTNEYLLDFLEKNAGPKIKIFTDIVSNTEKVYDFKTKISWFISSTNYYAEYSWAKELLFKINTPRQWEPRSKFFDCLLGTKKKHRDIIQQFYNCSEFKDKIDFTYYESDPANGVWGSYHNINENFNDHIRFDTVDISPYAIVPYYVYNNSYYSIVAETTAFNSYNQYTEKVIKPILARRPFVAFCGQHYLRNLRSLGFKTFGDVIDIDGKTVIDESYDQEPDDLTRWQMAWKQVEELCTRDPILTYAQLQSILDYNLMHFVKTNWHQEILNELLMPFD